MEGEAKTTLVELFKKIGLNERTAEETTANVNVTNNLCALIEEVGVTKGCERSIGILLYTVATKFPAEALVHRPKLLEYIGSSKIKTLAQLEAAFAFLTDEKGSENLDINKFEEACGVGIKVSREDIEHIVNEVCEEKKSAIFAHVRNKQPWADTKMVNEVIDLKLKASLGEKSAEDNEKPGKKKKEKKAKVEDKGTTKEALEAVPSEEEPNPFSIFPEPKDNNKVHTEVIFSDRHVLRPFNSPEILKKHLDATKEKVLTRFPPEPNGYLHIGHAKAMFINFGLAEDRCGDCYLRFDDTNPKAEKQEYIDHIKDIVGWMGWEPSKITYTSDYFQKLYDLAVELIESGHAYVDDQTVEQINECREYKMNSPCRDRPIEESLELFNKMKKGEIAEKEATLRMKQDMQNDNPNMYDLVAYRINKTRHPRTGEEWCIYPTYDFAHCIVDSLENITHSLCTLEFETRRASYYWLLDMLGLYKPYVWEYSRLNITNTVLSKRKLNKLVTGRHVDGWDDPRLMTLSGLRRRGVTSTAINAFVRGIGITRSDSMIPSERLDYHIRDELNETASRTMVVLRPLKVVIDNLDANLVLDVNAKKWPNAPNDDTSSCYEVPFSKVVYIEQTDFREKDSKDYKGLAPGKTVLLKYAFPIKCTQVVHSEDKTTVIEIHAVYDPDKNIAKRAGVLHWVAEPSPGVDPLKVEVRLFNKLFKSENPGELDKGLDDLNPDSKVNPGEHDKWLDDLNPESKVVIPCAYGVPSLRFTKVGDKFQFERNGYFVADKDSTPEKLVFNRIVTMKDSKPGSKRVCSK